ncbi:hypothetical protein JN11_01867 [Mucilaginibacter frigoritolerans]|uniref:Uncharacterized protein n=1 Tax=Mucilaginibacter frigoritolerans TaxID=652788 RepID=A0A562U7A0_9SPHI|nr:hypothetical protein [Mucilaginibacter frigoritolerans]TWJ01713.1 hypothetical protein JN11_01867 [Mucilaginibacter frigoritolerans]
MKLTNILVRVKDYQLFLIFLVSALLASGSVLGRIVGCLSFCVYIVWIYSIGSLMRELIPNKLRPKITYFRMSCLVLIVGTIVILMIFGGYSINQDNYKNYGKLFWVFLFIQLFLMWSLIYIVYFAAKMLMSIVEGEIVDFNKSYKFFFAIWIYPVGLWIVQPAVQRILSQSAGQRKKMTIANDSEEEPNPLL